MKILRGIAVFLAFFIFQAQAEVPQWQIVPDESTLTFTATQNGAPVNGGFKAFEGSIAFDPNQLESSHVEITVDMSSVMVSFQDVVSVLKTSEWFDVRQFPKARYKATHFKLIGPHQYQAEGTLSIRDKELPVELIFDLKSFTQEAAEAVGSTTIKRTAFGVGQGEWQSTKEIKDEVKIDFDVKVKKQVKEHP